MKSLVRFWQDKSSANALEELKTLAQLSSRLAYKASVDGSETKQACRQLSTKYDKHLTSNAAIVKRLTQSQPWTKKAAACHANFSQVFFSLTSISRPWKTWVLERDETEFKKTLDKLLSAFLQTSRGRVMSLEGRIYALEYQQDLLKLWLETPPSLPTPTENAEENTLTYRGVTYRRNALGELITLAAQAKHYAGDIKALTIETGSDEFTQPAAEKSAAQLLSLIKHAPYRPEEQFSFTVLETADFIQAKAARFFLSEQNLGNLTVEEFTRILAAREQLFSALSDCIQSSISAHNAQLRSTSRLIKLAEVMLESIKTTK